MPFLSKILVVWGISRVSSLEGSGRVIRRIAIDVKKNSIKAIKEMRQNNRNLDRRVCLFTFSAFAMAILYNLKLKAKNSKENYLTNYQFGCICIYYYDKFVAKKG